MVSHEHLRRGEPPDPEPAPELDTDEDAPDDFPPARLGEVVAVAGTIAGTIAEFALRAAALKAARWLRRVVSVRTA